MRVPLVLSCVFAVVFSTHTAADEGFWTFNDFPGQRVKETYGFMPSGEWLDHVRLSSLRTPGACSASFVSRRALILTNHHCVVECLKQLSSASVDFFRKPFVAFHPKDETRCPSLELNQLMSITDVTDRIRAATDGMSGDAYKAALQAEKNKIETACAVTERDRCDVVELYRGGRYDLYSYRRYQDVRLVFAPEYGAGQFGGDPDNFSFPRYGFDVAMYRVYEDGRPLDSSRNYFRWSISGPADGELTFVSGHPGRTNRLMTADQLQFERDTRTPFGLAYYAEKRGLLTGFGNRGDAERLASRPDLFQVENTLKLIKGHLSALTSRQFIDETEGTEREFRKQVASDHRTASYAEAWDIIAEAVEHSRRIFLPYLLVEGLPQRQPLGFDSELAAIARILVRASVELQKPQEQRLREYTEANLPALKQALFSSAPIHKELEVAELSFGLVKLREELGADDEFVRRVFRERAPAELARELIEPSVLADIEERRRLFDGGRQAIEASTDPMIVAMRDLIDPYARRVRDDYETHVEAPFAQGGEKIARALFTLRGSAVYPDATGTLRLSFGQAKGPPQHERTGAFATTIRGAFARNTGRDPFALPKSWLEAKDKLDLDLTLNVATTNETVGGNSGSPLLNRDAEVVGVVFDSNLSGRASAYLRRPGDRAVSVSSAAILPILSTVYGASRIVGEIQEANR